MKYIYKQIDKKYLEDYIKLCNSVVETLKNRDFLIPFSNDDIVSLFNDEKTIIYGVFDGDKLIGSAQLNINQEKLINTKDMLGLCSFNVAELGGYLVLSEYRNQGITKFLEQVLIEVAKNNNIEYIVITVHPDNIPSKKAIEHTKAKFIKTIKLGNYLREVYLLNIVEK